jgi:hypothetical protein
VTWSLCIKHHIDVHHDALIASVKIGEQKKFITPGLSPLRMAIENGFSHHKICDYIFNFDVIELED